MNGNGDHHRSFGNFVLDAERRQLFRDGRPVSLAGKAFDLLSILVASPGKAFSREELYDLLWPDEAVEDGNLTQNIYLLRRALHARDDGRRFIETIKRYGYRFVHPMDPIGAKKPIRAFRVPRAFAAVVLLACIVASSAPQAPSIPQRAAEAEALGEFHLSLRGPADLHTALLYFDQAMKAAPHDASAYADAAAALALLAEYDEAGSVAQQGHVARARAMLRDAFAHNAQDSRALAVSGFIAYRFDNDYDAARKLLAQAIAQDPGNAAAHHWYGVTLLAAGDLTGATRELEGAHAIQPTSEVISRWLARAYMLAGRPDDAIATVRQALRIVPDDAAANLILASAEESRGHLGIALHIMQSLGKRAPFEWPYLIPEEARVRRALHENVRLAHTDGLDPFETAVFFVSIGDQQRATAILRPAKRSKIDRALEMFDPRLKRLRLNAELRRLLAVAT